MKNINGQKNFLPQYDGGALDFIKLFAAIFMVIDHINTIYLHHAVPVMEFIGRGAFPLFCYAVAAAVLKQVEKEKARRYVIRLLILALVSQPFFYAAFGGDTLNAAFGGGTANVLFTLVLGAVFAGASLRAKLWQMYVLYVIALISMLWTLPLEFGLAGAMLPSAIVLVQRGHKSAWPFLILLLLFMNAGGILGGMQAQVVPAVWGAVALDAVSSMVLPWLVVDLARSIRQTKRFLPKYALYIFYPAHLAVLTLLALI